jgi:hypothetical protein
LAEDKAAYTANIKRSLLKIISMEKKTTVLFPPIFRIYSSASNDPAELQRNTNMYFAECENIEVTDVKYQVNEIQGRALHSVLIVYKQK